jgi:hypothetical protein
MNKAEILKLVYAEREAGREDRVPTDKLGNPWTKQTILDAVERGEVDCLTQEHGVTITGIDRLPIRTIGWRLHDRKLGDFIADVTLKGFGHNPRTPTYAPQEYEEVDEAVSNWIRARSAHEKITSTTEKLEDNEWVLVHSDGYTRTRANDLTQIAINVVEPKSKMRRELVIGTENGKSWTVWGDGDASEGRATGANARTFSPLPKINAYRWSPWDNYGMFVGTPKESLPAEIDAAAFVFVNKGKVERFVVVGVIKVDEMTIRSTTDVFSITQPAYRPIVPPVIIDQSADDDLDLFMSVMFPMAENGS